MIPVAIVTGFLGSGKTTLISRVLRDPTFARTAVIVNEFGEVGLDHDLIASSSEAVLELTTGCLCCAVQTDLVQTMLRLMAREHAGDIGYDRILIETSGLADPTPILLAMMTDNQITATHQVVSVTTLIDTLHGELTLTHHIEARRQVAMADRLLLSKTDVAEASESLLVRLRTLNPQANIRATTQLTAASLFAREVEARETLAAENLPLAASLVMDKSAAHSSGIDSFVLTRDQPLPALALTLLLQALAEHCGTRLLRMKGLVAIEEMPGQPALINGVRHVVSSPVFLAGWPSTDVATRIVFITTCMPRYFASRLLDAIEVEVRQQAVLARR